MVTELRKAAVVTSSDPVVVSIILDPSEMTTLGVSENPDIVKCHMTGVGDANTSESLVWLLEPEVKYF